MKVTLNDYTGAGSPDPARHAANVLVFTKQTRLNMTPSLMAEIEAWPWEKIEAELAYMANTIPSSWEWVNYSFVIEGVTRAFTHQFVRTRTGSYAQQTMRVLDVSGFDVLTGPTIRKDLELRNTHDFCVGEISAAYKELVQRGAAIEDARGILPTNILTNIVARWDLRTVADTARKRASSRTQGEYRDVMDAMLKEVKRVHPWTALFLDRSFDRAAADLEHEILARLPAGPERTHMIKLIDQMRATA